MPTRKIIQFPEFIFKKLEAAGWPGVAINRTKTAVTCPTGEIVKVKNNNYHLKFVAYSSEKKEYFERPKYKKVIFPKNYKFKNKLFFRRNSGNYKISYESQFKKIINPAQANLETIKIIRGNVKKTVYGKTMILSDKIFSSVLLDARSVYEKGNSYRLSTENYFSEKDSEKYGYLNKRKTTYMQKGEFAFIIDRFNLSTKLNKSDFLKYLDKLDLDSLEIFIEELLKREVLSQNFTTKLNDYFIKEKLRNIIHWGKDILELGTSNLTTSSALKVISELGLENIDQLENLWQKYFEKYLLYLFFSYKKIFPRV